MSAVFSHLRISSEYSITQGLITVSPIVESAEKYKIPSIALTDVGNMFGLVKFFSKCESKGIKPLSGVSLNFVDNVQVKVVIESLKLFR